MDVLAADGYDIPNLSSSAISFAREVFTDYLKVWDLVEHVELQPGSSHKLIWRWSSDGAYSASSAYRAMFMGSCVLRGARETWKTPVPSRAVTDPGYFFSWGELYTQDKLKAQKKHT
jgi:hypothetical protein